MRFFVDLQLLIAAALVIAGVAFLGGLGSALLTAGVLVAADALDLPEWVRSRLRGEG
ncbi:MAG: hypothetical protein AAGN46_01295 [Acidobacteriota bacterium]